jgi:hypothetical protein
MSVIWWNGNFLIFSGSYLQLFISLLYGLILGKTAKACLFSLLRIVAILRFRVFNIREYSFLIRILLFQVLRSGFAGIYCQTKPGLVNYWYCSVAAYP